MPKSKRYVVGFADSDVAHGNHPMGGSGSGAVKTLSTEEAREFVSRWSIDGMVKPVIYELVEVKNDQPE